MIGLPLKDFYHCKLLPSENKSLKFYDAPIKKSGNYQPLSSYNDVAIYGQDIQNRWRLVVDMRLKGEYSIGDLLYLDGKVPDNDKANGVGANGVISAIQYGFRAITIEIESTIPRR
jgi:hypothetical protein